MSHTSLPHDHGAHSLHLAEHMPDMGVFATVSDAFKLLSDPNRARVYWLLCHCEECVINLSAMTGMSSPALSHHLKLLKAAGLVISRREGKEVYYTAAHTDAAETLHRMIEKMIRVTCPTEESAEHIVHSAE